MSPSIDVFDRTAVRRHKSRAAGRLEDHDFLFKEAGERLADRLDDIKRSFPLALDLGCRGGQLARLLGGRGGIQTLVHSDLSLEMLRRAEGLRVAADEEALPFSGKCFDLVLSCLCLHWVNDLPGLLVQVRRALKPDGLFLAAMLGGETLKELRQALGEAELAVEGAVSPRVSPFADIRDLGALLQRAGMALPVADADTIEVTYEDPGMLMRDLRGMGESNAQASRRKGFTRRATLSAAMARYKELFADAKGCVPATFEVITLTAWAPQ